MDLALWKQTKKERGLTYQDIARDSGLPLGTIKNIFAGYTPDPRESTIIAIERALGVETRIVHTVAPAPQLSDEEKELLETFRKLPSGLKIRAQAYLSGMVEALTPEKKKTPSA